MSIFEKLRELGDKIEIDDPEVRDDGAIGFKVWHSDALLHAHGADAYYRYLSMRVEDGAIVEFAESIGGWSSHEAVVAQFQAWLDASHPEVGPLVSPTSRVDLWESLDATRTAMDLMAEYAAYRGN